ncbi:MAG: hypothetical protein EOO15_19485 [Chitinophagaceae bacterium]|nr:MAG: hypothetical protein EOO15_19485 [Chitinophagaceae bacterium]
MKTLLDLDLNSIAQYEKWESANKNNWDITSYLNKNYDMNAAVAFSKLFFPDFLEIDGCVLLAFRYVENTYKQWKSKFGDDLSTIERHCNLYDVQDYFHINTDIRADSQFLSSVEQFSKALKVAWEANCKLLFPDRKITVDVFESFGIKQITLYTERVLNTVAL